MKRRLPLLLFVPALVAQTQHITPYTGTWKLNKARSAASSGPPPQSVTMRATEDGKSTVSEVDDQGKLLEWSFPWSDGKEVPVEGIPNATMTQTIRDRTCDGVLKIAGKPIMMAHVVVSADGKTQKATVTTINEKGQRTEHVEVYEKQ